MARYAVCYGVLAPLQRVKTIPSSPIVSRRAPSSLPRILRAAPGWSSAISANSLDLSYRQERAISPRSGEVMRPQTGSSLFVAPDILPPLTPCLPFHTMPKGKPPSVFGGIRCGLCRYRSTESFFVRRIGFGGEGGYGAVAIS